MSVELATYVIYENDAAVGYCNNLGEIKNKMKEIGQKLIENDDNLFLMWEQDVLNICQRRYSLFYGNCYDVTNSISFNQLEHVDAYMQELDQMVDEESSEESDEDQEIEEDSDEDEVDEVDEVEEEKKDEVWGESN